VKDTNTTEAVAVLRDTSTGDCFLVSTGTTDSLDVERLSESWLELVGWLRYPSQHDANVTDEWREAPDFTTCEWGYCGRLILIIDEMAPEFCNEHEQKAAQG
jgi:hypothetical protein